MEPHIKPAVPSSLRFLSAMTLSVVIGSCAFSPASAQTSAATVTGLVKDGTGANVGGAMVTLVNSDTNVTRSTIDLELRGFLAG
jgi:hypothetical protein